MSNMYLEVMDVNSVYDYQMDIIARGNIRLFLPTTFLFAEDGGIVSYADGEGYIRIGSVDRLDPVKAIDMIGMLADGMRDAAQNYIFPQEYEVDEDTVFIDKKMESLRLMFRPSRENQGKEEMSLMLSNMGSKGGTPAQKGSPGFFGTTGQKGPPGPLEQIYKGVRSLADILSCKVGQGNAGPVWEAARLFRGDGYGPAEALQELAQLRHKVWLNTYGEKEEVLEQI